MKRMKLPLIQSRDHTTHRSYQSLVLLGRYRDICIEIYCYRKKMFWVAPDYGLTSEECEQLVEAQGLLLILSSNIVHLLWFVVGYGYYG